MRIRWEDLTDDFESKVIGSLVVALNCDAPFSSSSGDAGSSGSAGQANGMSLVVSRVGPDGKSAMNQPLPAEDEVIQRLYEGIEVTYLRSLAVRAGALKEKEVARLATPAEAAAATTSVSDSRAPAPASAKAAVEVQPTPEANPAGRSKPKPKEPDAKPMTMEPQEAGRQEGVPKPPTAPKRKRRSRM